MDGSQQDLSCHSFSHGPWALVFLCGVRSVILEMASENMDWKPKNRGQHSPAYCHSTQYRLEYYQFRNCFTRCTSAYGLLGHFSVTFCYLLANDLQLGPTYVVLASPTGYNTYWSASLIYLSQVHVAVAMLPQGLMTLAVGILSQFIPAIIAKPRYSIPIGAIRELSRYYLSLLSFSTLTSPQSCRRCRGLTNQIRWRTR